MPEDELRALADDIEKNGLRELVTIWKVDGRWTCSTAAIGSTHSCCSVATFS
jgi:hypothetical protein